MRKEAEAWLRISAEDLQSAEVLSDRKLFRPACYHARQAVEKSLKALLIDRNLEIPRTHNRLDLNNAVKKLGYAVAMTDEDAVFLSSIYRARYTRRRPDSCRSASPLSRMRSRHSGSRGKRPRG
jgi:HEPN domain-containing protein